MEPEKRKTIDGVITKSFLENNQKLVRMLVLEFGNEMKHRKLTGNGNRFYLKGGNALAILADTPADGDYDFQLRPPDEAYADWGNAFQVLDREIMGALEAVVTNVANQVEVMPVAGRPAFDVNCFTVATLQGWSDTAGNPIHEDEINLEGLGQNSRRDNILRIGMDFQGQAYQQIVSNPNYTGGRLEGNGVVRIRSAAFAAATAQKFGPMIYVNYTIPGFILYRLVYSYRYSIGDDSFTLKSEIIDLSVPRPGSAEVFMSQNGVVTHFRPAVAFPFDIPGWGYHFYENINLLQEIELGVSGSPGKRKKREDRLKAALTALLAANQATSLDGILGLTIKEPEKNAPSEGPYKDILGYFGALANNVDSYLNAYNPDAISAIRTRVKSALKSRFEISESYWGKSKYENWEKLVLFGLKAKFDRAANTVDEARSLLGAFLAPYRSRAQFSPKLDMVSGRTFQYVSPFTRLAAEGLQPCYYVVAEVTSAVFQSLSRFYTGSGQYQAHKRDAVTAFSCRAVSSAHGYFRGWLYVIFQDCGSTLTTPTADHVNDMLSRSILESQRFTLAECIQHGSNSPAAMGGNEDFYELSRSPAISELFEKLKAMETGKTECKLADLFPDLPGYYEEPPYDPEAAILKQVPRAFLADLVLTGLENVCQSAASGESAIEFEALPNMPGFLKASLCPQAIAPGGKIYCRLEETAFKELVFSGTYAVAAGTKIQVSGLTLPVSSFVFSSGTETGTSARPMFAYHSGSATGLPLTVWQAAGSTQWGISEDFAGETEVSMTELLADFGMGNLDFNACLPAEFSAALFERLAPRRVEIDADKKEVQAVFFDISSKAPLTLLENAITFTPGFRVQVSDPFGLCSVDFQAYGELKLDETGYEIFVIPASGDITFAMKDGETLNLKAVSKRFFQAAVLPALHFDKLYAAINYRNRNFMFGLQTVDVLSFSIASKELAIERISLQVWCAASRFTVTLKGLFAICGRHFELSGTYSDGKNYRFSACITENIPFTCSRLLDDFLGGDCNMGESFNFAISQLEFRCQTGENPSFEFALQAKFCGNDDTLKKIFAATANISVEGSKTGEKWRFGVDVGCELEIGESQTLECRYEYKSTGENKNAITLAYQPKTAGDAITLADVLHAVGFEGDDSQWRFLAGTGLSKVTLAYDFTAKTLSGEVELTSGGSLKVSLTFDKTTEYNIVMSSTAEISLTEIPMAGGLVAPFLPAKDRLSVKDISFHALSSPDEKAGLPAGVRLNLMIFGQKQGWQIYEPKPENQLFPVSQALSTEESAPPKVYWIKMDKTVAIFSLHRMGLGLDGSYLTLVLDASLNVSPLTFRLYGAGVGVSLSDFDLKFYISGFGLSYESEALAISGELAKNGGKYAGTLLIRARELSMFAVAEYSAEGSLFAYAVLTAKLGGPPALFITGLALGFGYNKRIVLPAIDKVADFPLIKGATGELPKEGLLAALEKFLLDEKGQKFLCAGIRFTSFEIAKSFALLTVSFGNSTEVDLLGLSDITMPPHCPRDVTPIAHAQLALKASFRPAEGFVGVEARLTSESYVLSKQCRLTGGFALYLWFDGDHAGDFVITLGGYHPKYALTKPAHYPDVPRVGFLWNIGTKVNITGEMYFALTPGVLMAGGRLSMTYTQGDLKAYFIVKADFLIGWKPYHYDAMVGVTIGASYRVNKQLVSFTLSVELGADLHIWGPDFTGTARISFWILSFTVSFGANASREAQSLDWDQFCTSFLPKAEAGKNERLQAGNGDAVAPLTISFGNGLNGQVLIGDREVKSVSPGGMSLTATSALPVHEAKVNNASVTVSPVAVQVKPMGDAGTRFSSRLEMNISRKEGGALSFRSRPIVKNMPTALWGGAGDMLADVPCGVVAHAFGSTENEEIFPETSWISLDDLYKKSAMIIKNAFTFEHPENLPLFTDKDSIGVYSATANSDGVRAARERFLHSLGVSPDKPINLSRYAAQAESYFDEEPWLPVR